MISFLTDEIFENDISINNNSIGALLESSSSGESFSEEFVMPQ